jgi:hypothetical protein
MGGKGSVGASHLACAILLAHSTYDASFAYFIGYQCKFQTEA